MMLRGHYTYPSWQEWTRVMELTDDQVKAFIPEFDGRNMMNKDVVVLNTNDMAYDNWVRLAREQPVPSYLHTPPLVQGIVGIFRHDGRNYLIKAR